MFVLLSVLSVNVLFKVNFILLVLEVFVFVSEICFEIFVVGIINWVRFML